MGTGWPGCWPAREGVRVWEVSCPDRSRRRRQGKSDPVDAENAARAVLAQDVTAILRTGGVSPASCGWWWPPGVARSRPAPRPPTRSRRSWAEGDGQLRAPLRPLRKARFARACAALEPTDALPRTLAVLGRRQLALNTEARQLEAQITALIRAHAPKLPARHRVGPVTAIPGMPGRRPAGPGCGI
jgi:transposase